ncbi:MAG: transglycosylase SLT domain-containing protein [Pyrinomonadaceae bacterium]
MDFRSHRITFIIIGFIVVIGASVAPFTFMRASCSTHQQTTAEKSAQDQLRAMTRGGVLPGEDAVARIESQFPNTKTAALARIVRARIRANARDFAGAASLLDTSLISERTSIGDYALWMRADALEQAGRRAEARAVYEELAREFPTSLRAREATLHVAQMLMQDSQAAAVPALLKELYGKDDAAALLLTAKAYEQTSDSTRSLAAYRRLYFYAPASVQSSEAATSLARLQSTAAPATAEEATTRAEKLFDAKRYADAYNAYTDAFTFFPATANAQAQLRRGISAENSKRTTEAVAALNSVPASNEDLRAEALYHLVQTYARARQWDLVRAKLDEMRRVFPKSDWTPRAHVGAGQLAQSAKNDADASYFYRSAVAAYPGAVEVAQAQFEMAWQAHEAKNYQESSRLLTEHLALYADRNTDNRGRAGYWAARDSERAGKLSDAINLYQAMQERYDANWYGYLAKQRLDTIMSNSQNRRFALAVSHTPLAQAMTNLQTVSVAEETAGPNEIERITKADQLSNIGLDDYALEELGEAEQNAPNSPRVNLALARIYRSREDNVRALNILKQSYPDYSQMKPEEMTREEWDVFYPLAYWDIITQESRARRLDPYQVAGLIRQETVFNPRARSVAKAYGLMQLLVPTGTLTAKKYGVDRAITADSLYEPRLNIQLGTAYLREQIDKYGRIEYVAAAYNAGPLRVVQWRETLPLEIDEWAEAIPFKETRGYVQGVVRNTMQYRRLYDDNGQFRANVGTQAVNPSADATKPTGPNAVQPANSTVRRRRVMENEEE